MEFLAEKEVVAGPGARNQRDRAVAVTVGQRFEHDGPQRSEAYAACDDDQITADRVGQAPAGAERPAHADYRARLRVMQCTADGADRADGVGDGRRRKCRARR